LAARTVVVKVIGWPKPEDAVVLLRVVKLS
jgi:hypothetical protein